MAIDEEKKTNNAIQDDSLNEEADETEKELDAVLNEETPEESEAEKKPEEAITEEAKPAPRKKKEEEEIVEERIYTVPLSKALIMPPKKRTPRAMRMLEAFITKHMKLNVRLDEEEEAPGKKLIITNEVNEKLWSKGIEKPPRKIRIRAAKDKEGIVTVYLAEGE